MGHFWIQYAIHLTEAVAKSVMHYDSPSLAWTVTERVCPPRYRGGVPIHKWDRSYSSTIDPVEP